MTRERTTTTSSRSGSGSEDSGMTRLARDAEQRVGLHGRLVLDIRVTEAARVDQPAVAHHGHRTAGMAYFRMKSLTTTSYDCMPGTAVPVIAISCYGGGGGGEAGDVVASPPHARRAARHAIRIGVNDAVARVTKTVRASVAVHGRNHGRPDESVRNRRSASRS